jgi:pimeloyl-ACP methyl ester carboxylesterase
MTTLKVLGNRDESLKNVKFGANLGNFSVSEAVQFSSDRASSSYQMLKGLKKDDVIELIYEEDIHRWVTVEELEREFKYQLSRGEEADVLEIPARLPTGETSRGATTWALKALRVLKFDPVKAAADKFAEFWDSRIMPKPGLFRFAKGFDKPSPDIKQLKLKDKKPILLFIHGTFSSAAGGFGGFHPEVWKALQQEYGEHIFGYDHKTLSLSPVENTLDLVKRLPAGARLHLVTHSRGGLIGELLCRGTRKDKKTPFDADDLSLVAENPVTAKALTELSDLLAKKKVVVERFVRVACPTRGTALAGKKLDRWLEVIINVIGKLLPPGAAETYGVITDLLLDFKKQAADPEAMPGLASMVPESNFIKLINRPDVELDADLTVIAGDIERNDITGRLAVFFTDLFYSDENDLVVQTPAMYGGPTRKNGRYFFYKGPGVHHSSYFSNKRTAEVVKEALVAPSNKLGAKGFRPLDEAYVSAVPEIQLDSRSFQKRANLSQPVVYILPGIMGTHLAEGGSRIWLNVLELAQGRVANLRIANQNVQPQALVRLAYANLVDYLSATHEVIPFPFDWRLSIMDESNRFADALEAKLQETGQPIRILAHSMGGLVTRAMIAQRPELWERISKRNGSRFVMLGTPNRGSYQIPRLILGQEKTFRMLAMLDIRNSVKQLLDVIVRFPGVLQLLPMDSDGALDFLDAGTWDKFPNTGGKWVKPQEKDLEQARKFHEFLDAGRKNLGDWSHILYVAGYGRGAPVAVELAGKNEVTFVGTNQGDGTVPWESGILPEFGQDRTYYMDVPHGDLANHKESFAAIYDLLNDGLTTRLSKTPPRYDRSQEERYPLRDEGVEIYPSQLDLETSVLGASPVRHQAPVTRRVKVSVVHGNLSFCSDPLAVGHYEGDGLYSAEKALDHHLNGRLSDRIQLGRYPGPEGTAEVVLNDPGKRPGGAIIVGLGKAGELSPRKLTDSFANALREFGIKAMENKLVGDDGALKISTLLIGTGGNGLSITNSVDAILSAVLQANRSFSQIVATEQGTSHALFNIRITEIQFIELFKDQAILAAKALASLQANDAFDFNTRLQKLQGGWKRLAYEEPAGWWQRIHIRAEECGDDSLIFSVPTDRARSEDSRLPVQRSSLNRLIAQAVRFPNWDQDLASAMFELTVPNRIKGSFKDMQSSLFVVDKEAARYPWELMYDRRSGEDLPLVVQMGMIRQFSTFNFQERVVDVKNKQVMVIGNPANAPAGFSDLPGAEQEAQQVASKLEEHGFEVRRAIHSDPEYIMSHLFSKDYRVLHLAGHGVYRYLYRKSEDAQAEEFTGMVLGDGIFLTANEIRQKMNIPELVFINCCHLGKFSSPEEDRDPKYAFNDFAASLSEELINMGVKAVIAAGWAVDDAAALTFAEVFYERLLMGDAFGDAVKAARVETYRLHRDRTNTWGAYQCYGDPTYRLVIKAEDGQSRRNRFVDIEEAIVRVNQIYELAKTTSAQGIGRIRNNLSSVLKDIEENNEEWLKDAALLNALGEAFGEAFLFEDAARHYQQAVVSGRSVAPVKALEQLANCNIRLAVREYENNPAKYTASKAGIEEQIGKLNQLMDTVGETTERLSMVGSGYKRLALISAGKSQTACDSALKKMETAYWKAWKKANDTYPLKNYLVTAIVQMLRSGVQPKGRLAELKQLIDLVQGVAVKNKLNAPDDFWANVGVTEAKFVDRLHQYVSGRQKSFTEELSHELVDEYRVAWEQYGSARELNSILEHYTFLAAVLKKNEKNANLCREIEKIASSLKSMLDEGQ